MTLKVRFRANPAIPLRTRRLEYLPPPSESPRVEFKEMVMLSRAPEYLKAGMKGR
jgi:hypothetical protein